MRFRIMTRDELLELYRNNQEICYRIAQKQGFMAPRPEIPYFNSDMYRYLGEKITIRDDDDITFKANILIDGYWWSKEWLISIEPEIIDIDKDMALKLI